MPDSPPTSAAGRVLCTHASGAGHYRSADEPCPYTVITEPPCPGCGDMDEIPLPCTHPLETAFSRLGAS